DQAAGEPAEQNRGKGDDAGGDGGDSRQGALGHSTSLETRSVEFRPVRATVIIPTYNEAGNITDISARVRAALPEAAILVVHDASPDGTAELARRAGNEVGNLTVLERPGKAGLGTAYRAGFAHALDAGADVCIQIDADLSHDPDALPALVANVEFGADLAIGSR